jgi:UDP-glucose 4-epimerase
MAVLITGGAGYIGSHMVLELLDSGTVPVVLDNLTTGFRAALPPQVPLVVGDVGDVELVDRVLETYKIESIIHFAAKLVVPESVVDPLGYYGNNTAKSCRLMAAAVRHGVKHFVFSSTAAVYGNTSLEPVSEETPVAPLTPYGWSKLMSETMLRDASAAHPGLRHVILRYFNVAGADPQARSGHSRPDGTHLLKVALQAALGQRPYVEVFGQDYPTPDGSCIRDYIHISDLIRAHSAALAYLRDGGDSITCNCGYGRGYSVLEALEAVKRVTGVDFTVRRGPRREGDPVAVVAKADRVRQRLGWQPQWDDLDTIIRHALAWEEKILGRGIGDLPVGAR